MSSFAGTVSTPHVFADELLTVASTALGGTTGGEIENRFVDHEVSSVDCEMLAVLMGGITMRSVDRRTELGAAHAHVNGWMNIVTYRILVARDCLPVVNDNGDDGSPPTPEQRTATMELLAEDVWAIWHAVILAMGAGEILGGRCAELFMDNATPLPISGMTGGWVITLRALVPGYVPA